jgi:hypothetical protein
MTTRIERHRRWKIEVVLSYNPGPKEKVLLSKWPVLLVEKNMGVQPHEYKRNGRRLLNALTCMTLWIDIALSYPLRVADRSCRLANELEM